MKCLDGIRVIELSTFVAAAATGRILAEQGADVIKVEPLRGDDWRVYFPAAKENWDKVENPMWEIFNTNKRSVSLNLKDPECKAIFYDLLASADVMLTNYRTNALKGLGLDYDTIKEKFPKLIYAHLTPYGLVGPAKDEPGYDSVAFWARSGFMVDLVPPGSYPIATPGGVGDCIAGTNLYGGICSALYSREKTGIGDYVEVSLYGTAVWTLAVLGLITQDMYKCYYPKTRDEGSPFVACYMSKDGQWFNATAPNNIRQTMDKIFEVMECPEYIGSPVFESMGTALNDKPAAYAMLDHAYGKFDFEEIARRLASINIPCQRLKHFKEMHTDPQALENGYFKPFTFDSGRSFDIPCNPIRFINREKAEIVRGSHVGENTDEILGEAGYAPEKLASLKAAGIIH